MGYPWTSGQVLTAADLDAAIANAALNTSGTVTVGGLSALGLVTAYSMELSSAIGSCTLQIDGPAGFTRAINITSGGLQRWSLYGAGTPESGGNIGTELTVGAWADDGVTFLGNYIQVQRSTGAVLMTGTLTAGALQATGGGAIGTTGTVSAGVLTSTGTSAVNAITVTTFAKFNGSVGFYGATPATKPTVTGSKGGNAALGSLLTALSTLGLITDSST